VTQPPARAGSDIRMSKASRRKIREARSI